MALQFFWTDCYTGYKTETHFQLNICVTTDVGLNGPDTEPILWCTELDAVIFLFYCVNNSWSDFKHRRDKSLDLSSLPMKNPIFQQSIVTRSGTLKFKFVKFCDVYIPLHLFPVVIFFNLKWDLQNLLL